MLDSGAMHKQVPGHHAPWDYSHPHIVEIEVSDQDIDGMGHANNACYVIWCERCAWQHSETLGLSVADYRQLNRGVAIHKASYDYYQPSFPGERLLVGTWLTACDSKLRLERRFQILRASDQSTVLRGHWILICINVSTGKPARFPAEFLDTYGAAVIDS